MISALSASHARSEPGGRAVFAGQLHCDGRPGVVEADGASDAGKRFEIEGRHAGLRRRESNFN